MTHPPPTPTIEFGKIGDYKIRLVADDGEIQTFRDLEIEHVNGNNDKPMALGIADLTLNENENAKAINLHQAFEDLQDTDTQLTFSITANSKPSLFQRLEIKGDPDNLHLIPATGQLGTSNISIRATDREGNFTDTNFSVTVRNQPPNILQQTLYLEENSPAGTIVGTVQAEDPDGDTPIFQIIAGNETGLFTIEPSNGRISLRPDAKVDYETTPSHTLNVAVTDERNPSPENNAEIRIYIVDQNEAPTVADATFNLGDTLKTGELVGPISGATPKATAFSLRSQAATKMDYLLSMPTEYSPLPSKQLLIPCKNHAAHSSFVPAILAAPVYPAQARSESILADRLWEGTHHCSISSLMTIQ